MSDVLNVIKNQIGRLNEEKSKMSQQLNEALSLVETLKANLNIINGGVQAYSESLRLMSPPVEGEIVTPDAGNSNQEVDVTPA